MRVLAADGQPLYRDAVARAIRERPELELVGQAGDGREALDAIGAEEPDVAVIDRTLSGLSGEQVLNAVEARRPAHARGAARRARRIRLRCTPRWRRGRPAT